MKYERTKELENFIKDNKLFNNFKSLREIYTGGSSYNFCVQTTDAIYLLKIIRNPERYNRVQLVLKALGILKELPVNDFAETEKLLVIPYIHGQRIALRDITPKALTQLHEQYKCMQSLDTAAVKVLPQFDVADTVRELDDWLTDEKGLMYRLINKYFWQKIKKELIIMPAVHTLIHGDMTANNILIDGDGKPHLLDFDQIRFGYPTEDFMGLFLQIAGFRGLYGSLNKLKRMLGIADISSMYTSREILYGVQCFYLRLLLRRTRMRAAKKENARKTLCLLVCLLGYFRVRELLSNQTNF